MTALALASVILSAFLHAAWNTAAKSSRRPMVFLFSLEVVTTVLGAPLLLLVDLGAFPLRLWLLLAGTSVAHGFYGYCLTRAYEEGDLSLVYPISRSTPAFVPLPAVLLLGEKLSLVGLAGIAAVLAGIWMVQTGQRLAGRGLLHPGLRFAYWTLVTTVLYSLVDKEAMALLDELPWRTSLPRAVAYYYLMSACHLPVFWLLARRRVSVGAVVDLLRGRPWSMFGFVVVALTSYGLILDALRTAPVSYVVAARQTSVVFAMLLALFWLREAPDRVRIFGALLTIAGVVLLAVGG